MATIAELQTRLTVDDSAFKRSMSNAAGAVSSFASSAATSAKWAAGIVTATLAGAFYGLIHIINQTQERVSDLVDTSTRLGVGIKPLQRLQYAAKQSGMSVQSLNAGLGKLLKNTELAAEGNATLVTTFAKLGLNAKALKNVGIDEEYIAISQAISKIKDPAQQALIATQLFGKGGIEHLSLLKDDVSGLVKEFQGLGTELSDKQGKDIESYGDTVSKLGAVWQGFKDQLTAALAGPLKDLMNWIFDGIKNMGGLKEVAKSAADFIITSFKGVVDTFKNILDGITKVRIAMTEFAIAKAKASLTVAEAEKSISGRFSSDSTNQVRESGINDLKNQISSGQKMVADLTSTLGQSGLQKKLEDLTSSISNSSLSNNGGSGTINGKPFPGLGSGPGGAIDGKPIEINGSPSFIINGKSMNFDGGPSMSIDGQKIELNINVNTDSGLTANVVNSAANKDVIIKTVNSAITEAARGEQR